MHKKVNYIRPTHLCRITGEKVEVLRYGVNKGTIPNSPFVIYYDHKGEYHDSDKNISDFIELADDEKIITKCEA